MAQRLSIALTALLALQGFFMSEIGFEGIALQVQRKWKPMGKALVGIGFFLCLGDALCGRSERNNRGIYKRGHSQSHIARGKWSRKEITGSAVPETSSSLNSQTPIPKCALCEIWMVG